MSRGRVIGGIVVLLLGVAMSAPYALAAGGTSAVDQGYPCATQPPGSNGAGSGNACQGVAGTVKTQPPTTAGSVAPATRVSGTLPFTGIQLGVFVAVGILLVGGGLILRASGRSRTDS